MKDTVTFILLVEDDPYQRELLSQGLDEAGYSVVAVGNGREAMLALEKNVLPSLLLLDVNLPDMSGLEVLALIRDRWGKNEFPVIMLSARDNALDIVKGFDAGANDYVTKPVVLPVLTARIEAMLSVIRSVHSAIEVEQQRVMAESLGAACHHLAQPMTAVLATIHMLEENPPDDPEELRAALREVSAWAGSVSEILHKLQKVVRYRTQPYVSGTHIVDIEARDTLHGTATLPL